MADDLKTLLEEFEDLIAHVENALGSIKDPEVHAELSVTLSFIIKGRDNLEQGIGRRAKAAGEG